MLCCACAGTPALGTEAVVGDDFDETILEPANSAPCLFRTLPAATYVVELHKATVDDKLGLSVTGKSLNIVGVLEEGLAPVWNAAHPELQIAVGHRILSANGVCKDGPTVLAAIASAEGKVLLTLAMGD
mmetsp:Transcript_33015/g.93903  ORF Transcript_33015/g.93903 Transcript_33015/m.93903 type:complete len:129 (-) Transcript_33015:84-470(-)